MFSSKLIVGETPTIRNSFPSKLALWMEYSFADLDNRLRPDENHRRRESKTYKTRLKAGRERAYRGAAVFMASRLMSGFITRLLIRAHMTGTPPVRHQDGTRTERNASDINA